MKIYRDDSEWAENCKECQTPMFRVILSKGKVLTGIPESVQIEKDSVYAPMFKLWAQHACMLPATVHWCAKCRQLWAIAVGLPFWAKAGIIEQYDNDLNRMVVRTKFDMHNDIIPVPASQEVKINASGSIVQPFVPEEPPYPGATFCVGCSIGEVVWREQVLQTTGDRVLVWHWCRKCGKGEPMPELTPSQEQIEEELAKVGHEAAKALFPKHEDEDVLGT